MTLYFRASDAPGSLDDLDLKRIPADDFFQEPSEFSRGSGVGEFGERVIVQTLSVRLFARRAGQLTIPAFEFDGVTRGPLTFEVAPPAGDLRIEPRVVPRASGGAAVGRADARMERETFELQVVISAAARKLDAQMLLPSTRAYHARALETERPGARDGRETVVLRHALTVLAASGFEVEFPPIEVRSQDAVVGRRLIQPRAFGVAVQPLPGFVPAWVPVGPVALESELDPPTARLGEPAVWRVRLHGAGLTETTLRQMFTLNPPQADAIEVLAPAFSITRGPVSTEETARLDIPLRLLRGGELKLPRLRLPYVDATTGRLENLATGGDTVTVIDPRAGRVPGGLALIALVLGLYVAALALAPSVRRWHEQRALRRRVRGSADARELHAALLTGSAARTLGQWFGRELPHRQELRNHLERLRYARYAEPQDEFPRLRTALLAALDSAH